MDYPKAKLRHIVRLAAGKYIEHMKEYTYKIYMSDVAYAIIQALGAKSSVRWYDAIKNDTKPEQKAEEVKQGILEEFKKYGGEK